MKCDAAERNLQAYIDGELAPDEVELLEDHLGECPGCRKVLAELREVNRLTRAAFNRSADSRAFAQGVIEQFQESRDAPTDVPESSQPPEPEEQPPSSIIGQSIAGHQIVQEIGTGAMGSVFKAVQLSMKRVVAFKILKKELAGDKSFIERFYREARSAGSLTHGNLIRVFDVGETEDCHYISMEFIEGENIKDILKREVLIDPERAVEIAIQSAEALDHAWKNGIIHRDIKPENIMLTAEGVVKVADMGLAKRFAGDDESSDITMAGQVMGTPYYMSPEQVRGVKDLNHLTDIYSLGATLFTMVTGRRPFNGKSNVEIMAKVLRQELRFPSDAQEELPSEMLKVIGKMMDKDRSRRYQTGGELLNALRELKKIINEGPAAKPAAIPSHRPPSSRSRGRAVAAASVQSRSSNPWIMRFAAIAAVIVIAVVILIILPNRHKPDPIVIDEDSDKNTGVADTRDHRDRKPSEGKPDRRREDRNKPVLTASDKAYASIIKYETDKPKAYAEHKKLYAEFLNQYPRAKKEFRDDIASRLGKVDKTIDGLFSEAMGEADLALSRNDYRGALEAWDQFKATYPDLAVKDVKNAIAGIEKKLARRVDEDMKKVAELMEQNKFDEALDVLANVTAYATPRYADRAGKRITEIRSLKESFLAEQKRFAEERENFDKQPLWREFTVKVIPLIEKGDIEAARKLLNSNKYASISHLTGPEAEDLDRLDAMFTAFRQELRKIADSGETHTFFLKNGRRVSGKLTPHGEFYMVNMSTKISVDSLSPKDVARIAKPGMSGSMDEREMVTGLWFLYNEKTVEKGYEAIGKLVEKDQNPDGEKARFYARISRKAEFITTHTMEKVLDRKASELYADALKEFNSSSKKTWERCMEKVDELLDEYNETKTVKENRENIESMQKELAEKLKPPRIGPGVNKKIAALFHSKIKKGKYSGTYVFTYDFDNETEMRDWDPGDSILTERERKKVRRKLEEMEKKEDKRRPWKVFKEDGKYFLYACDGRPLFWKAPTVGNFSIEFTGKVIEPKNIIVSVCNNREGQSYLCSLWLDLVSMLGDERWVRRNQERITGGADMIRMINHDDMFMKKMTGASLAEKKDFKLKVIVTRKGSRLSFSINGKTLSSSDGRYDEGMISIGALGGEMIYENVKIICKPDPRWVKEEYKELMEEREEDKKDKKKDEKEKDKEKKKNYNDEWTETTKKAKDKFGDELSEEDYDLIDRTLKHAPKWVRDRMEREIDNASKEDIDAVKEMLRRIREMGRGGGRPPRGGGRWGR